LRDQFHYAAVLLQHCRNRRDIDFAMRWGFGAKQGRSTVAGNDWLQVCGPLDQEDIGAADTEFLRRCPTWCSPAGG
jgi:3-hydroxyacyl-CoA dehydrogenase